MAAFPDIPKIQYEGPESKNPLAFRWYNPDEVVAGKTMREHFRFTVVYWHTFRGTGSDPFGAATLQRPWDDGTESVDNACNRARAAFELFEKLDAPFYAFHDRDVAPEGQTLAESHSNLDAVAKVLKEEQERSGVGLLWGTANLFSNPRYMHGAATSCNVEVYAYAAAQVKKAIEVTKELGGENYVLWGGREGYETLLNTDLEKELDQMGRFLSMVVDYKHKIGFPGMILVEPKPQEPSKHQYDFDVATCIGFLRKYNLENDVKINIEQGHAILAGHSFEHEIALAVSEGMLGSIDMNRNDYQSGWDTDQFPNNTPEVALAYYHIIKGGGFQAGGTNFDAKLRRQSIEAEDLIAAHVGAMDICARGFKAAAAMIEDGNLEKALQERYEGWKSQEAKNMLTSDLATITANVIKNSINPEPKSGKQEILENYINRFV